MSLTSVDLLEELRAALGGVEPLIAGRIVDIEMARVRVLIDVVNERDGERSDNLIGSMTLPLAPGASTAADA